MYGKGARKSAKSLFYVISLPSNRTRISGTATMRDEKQRRNKTGKAFGTPSPFKHMKPHPDKKDQVIVKDHNGKQISKPKPEGFDEYWKGKHR